MVAFENSLSKPVVLETPIQIIDVALFASSFGPREDERYATKLVEKLILQTESALRHVQTLKIFNLTITPLDPQLLLRRKANVASKEEISHRTTQEILLEAEIISNEHNEEDNCTFTPLSGKLNGYTFGLTEGFNTEADQFNLTRLLSKLTQLQSQLNQTVEVELIS